MEKEMATYSRILAWEIPRTEEPGGYSPWGHKESGTGAHICMQGCPKHNISKSLKLIREKGTIIHTWEGLHEV